MKTLLRLGLVVLWSVALWSSSPAAEGYASKSASGTTNAAVIFPGGPPLRVTDYDVTADNATNTLVFQVGTVGATVKKAAVGTNTSVTFGKTTLTTNDVVILQTAADAVTNKTVSIVATTTNQVVLLTNPLGTNLALGDVVRRKVGSPYTLYVPSVLADTAFILDRTNGLIANDILVAETTLAGVLSTAVVSTVTRTTVAGTNLNTLTLTAALPFTMAPWSTFSKLTNYYALSFAAANTDTEVVLNNSTNLTAGDAIIISPASGGTFRNVIGLAGTDYATTAVTFSAPIGNALAVGDNAFLLSDQASIPVGAASLRQTGNALFSVDRGRPLRVVVTGAAACRLNNVTVKYD